MYTFLKEEKKRNEKMLIPVGVEEDKKTYKLLTIENTNEIVEIKSNNHNRVSPIKFSTKRTEMPELTFRNLDSCGLQETYIIIILNTKLRAPI